jgi:hypothetical protein
MRCNHGDIGDAPAAGAQNFLSILVRGMGVSNTNGNFALNTSELLIGDSEIARRCGRVIYLRLAWDAVACIRQQMVKTPKGIVTIVQVCAVKIPFMRFQVTRRITFSNKFDDFPYLIDLLNENIVRNNIRVEINSRGTWDHRPRLDPAPAEVAQQWHR